MISVALCVYNGSAFIEEQLASIKAQTRPVNEIVVCNDRSTDDTIQKIESFAKTVDFEVIVHTNEQQLGSTKNFEKCLQLCRGDVIFLCDQDDSWHTDKVAKQMKFLEENPDKEAVFSNGGMINQESQPIDGSIWDEILFDKVAQDDWNNDGAYQILFRGFVVTGATLAIRKRALASLLPFPTNAKNLIHDGWIALILALRNQIGFVDEKLFDYRRHQSQQVGFGRQSKWVTLTDRFTRPRAEKLQPIVEEYQYFVALHDLLKNRTDIPKQRIEELASLKHHYQVRSSLPANRLMRFVPVFKEIMTGNYYDRRRVWWKTILGDLFE
jgi:glycosyltransferase involved in cell wall biosynthesis